MNAGGVYADLYETQFKGAMAGEEDRIREQEKIGLDVWEEPEPDKAERDRKDRERLENWRESVVQSLENLELFGDEAMASEEGEPK